MAFWLVAISEAGWTSRKKKVPLGIRLNTADSHTGKKQSAKKVRLWVLIFLLFYDFCSCLRKPIFEVSGPFLLRKKSTVWESAVNQRDRATGGFVGVYTHRQSGNSRFCLFHRRKQKQKIALTREKRKEKKHKNTPQKTQNHPQNTNKNTTTTQITKKNTHLPFHPTWNEPNRKTRSAHRKPCKKKKVAWAFSHAACGFRPRAPPIFTKSCFQLFVVYIKKNSFVFRVPVPRCASLCACVQKWLQEESSLDPFKRCRHNLDKRNC